MGPVGLARRHKAVVLVQMGAGLATPCITADCMEFYFRGAEGLFLWDGPLQPLQPRQTAHPASLSFRYLISRQAVPLLPLQPHHPTRGPRTTIISMATPHIDCISDGPPCTPHRSVPGSGGRSGEKMGPLTLKFSRTCETESPSELRKNLSHGRAPTMAPSKAAMDLRVLPCVTTLHRPASPDSNPPRPQLNWTTLVQRFDDPSRAHHLDPTMVGHASRALQTRTPQPRITVLACPAFLTGCSHFAPPTPPNRPHCNGHPALRGAALPSAHMQGGPSQGVCRSSQLTRPHKSADHRPEQSSYSRWTCECSKSRFQMRKSS